MGVGVCLSAGVGVKDRREGLENKDIDAETAVLHTRPRSHMGLH